HGLRDRVGGNRRESRDRPAPPGFGGDAAVGRSVSSSPAVTSRRARRGRREPRCFHPAGSEVSLTGSALAGAREPEAAPRLRVEGPRLLSGGPAPPSPEAEVRHRGPRQWRRGRDDRVCGSSGQKRELHASPKARRTDLQALQIIQKEIWQFLAGAYQEQADQLTIPQRFQVGDSVWVRWHQLKNLEPRWKGPFVVLLTTPTALKVDSIAHWIHAAHVKFDTSVPESNQAMRWKAHHTPNPLKIRLSRS
ncbi:uncharacterized protein LOC143437346, partial [Arvicanthis niloticus]|uniref:uncharacterized protein LOC143437346 n=1 Tax=Arvicanthis niloticus TaxID=61156 RepID=UPI00403CA9FF